MNCSSSCVYKINLVYHHLHAIKDHCMFTQMPFSYYFTLNTCSLLSYTFNVYYMIFQFTLQAHNELCSFNSISTGISNWATLYIYTLTSNYFTNYGPYPMHWWSKLSDFDLNTNYTQVVWCSYWSRFVKSSLE